ncbi:Z1 domain-containing protein [Cellulomonas citrea]|uniref:Z1 domain-containing protein n=1 Tax=Cellulomonas citrea TaxID=1909423 RepID=UPI0013592EBD|nr:Z1 domain-containing protein [Cellulomonas citrea]
MSVNSLDDDRYEAIIKAARMQPADEVEEYLKLVIGDEGVVRAFIERFDAEKAATIELRDPSGIGREDRTPWYGGPRKHDRFWPPLRQSLEDGLGEEATGRIDAASSKVVAMLDDPNSAAFKSKGLVVGHVQSGKTSNFTAVIAKAADAGYKVFIVLSGVHNALRRQTQLRLVKDLVEPNQGVWHQITTPDHDFVPPPNASSFLAGKEQRVLLVVKKNSVVLRKLHRWLRSADAYLGVPTLIIDDEADQATVATKTINPLIAKLIDVLPKVCYVGYTATPFANLLIDPGDERDFYPRDFILSLSRDAQYQGPETLFGREPIDGEDPSEVPAGLDMIRQVPVDELGDLRPASRSGVAGFVPVVTPSLREAILWFWLATAARRVRDDGERHSSMLIHADSNTHVHDSYDPPVRRLRNTVLAELRAGDATLEGELQSLWEREIARVPAADLGERPVGFAEIRSVLEDVVASTRVIRDHYRSQDRLDYDQGPVTVIAIGGNTLSRGLTLEGLVVSFFVRSANVYDTLLQMGRWFGYRRNYRDLPRVWMPDETKEWYTHLSTVEAEIRREIDRYLVEHRTPLDLAVRIRCHPKMRVTAPSKMTSSVRAAAAYGGQLVESRYFPTDPSEETRRWHRDNARAVGVLLEAVDAHGAGRPVGGGKYLWERVPMDLVTQFISAYHFHERSPEADRGLLLEYISRRSTAGGLARWDVAVMGVDPSNAPSAVTVVGHHTIGCVRRARISGNQDAPVADIKTLSGSRDEGIDLQVSTDDTSRAKLARLRTWQRPETGLVMLYPIDPVSDTGRGRPTLAAPVDVVWGAAIVFPEPAAGDVTVDYAYVAADLAHAFPAAVDEADEDDTELAAHLASDLDAESSDD